MPPKREAFINRPARRSALNFEAAIGKGGQSSSDDALALAGELKHSTNETEVLWHKHVEALNGIKLPCGLRPRPLTRLDHVIEHADTDTLISHQLSGLPGRLDLTRSQTLKYFGDQSRENFNKRLNWVQRQRNISITAQEGFEDTTPELFFDNELETIDHASLNYAFAPVRPERVSRKEHHLTFIEKKLSRMDQSLKADHDYAASVDNCLEKQRKELAKAIKSAGLSSSQDSKLFKSLREGHARELKELGARHDRKLAALKQDNDDEFSIADSMCTSAFVNTFEMNRSGPDYSAVDDEGADGLGLGLSPRTAYIDGCLRNNLNPRCSIVLRRNLTKELNLQHYCMGDKMGVLFAESISGLPFVQSINLTDNKLTDKALGPIITAIMEIPNLLTLDVSENVTGPVFADLLAKYLARPSCPLLKLSLRHADVDDFECRRFVDALINNTTLKELDLSNNKIGSAENLNTVMPDVVTGGEAFAILLRSPTSCLESLKLVWNLIRLAGACDFADALRTNHSLTYLDLSFNALSHEGGLLIGNSLLYNSKLKTLNISNNNIDARASFTICAGIIENHTIKAVHLDGNPIGYVGAKALMRVAVSVGGRTKVTADRCNITMKDDKAWFDYNKPLQKYQLNMEKPYERAILYGLLHLVATHHSYVFRYYNYDANPPASKEPAWSDVDMKSKGRRVDLIQIKAANNEDAMDEHEKETVRKLKELKRAASDVFLATRLFQEIDVDGGGELDIEEFATLLERVGVECDSVRLKETFDIYDTDGGGSIGMVEFFMFLRAQLAEANEKLSDYLETPVMSIKDSGTRYIPPQTGRIYVEVIDSFVTKPIYKMMTSHDRSKMVEAAKTSTDTSSMITLAIPCFKMRMQEGLNTFDAMVAEGGEKVKVATKILLQLSDSAESLRFLMRTLKDDVTEWANMKRELGPAIKPILGYPNGYYELDLAVELDVFCLRRLCELSETAKESRSELSKLGPGVVGDISQKGNWTCFRNEMLDGRPHEVDSDFARDLPKTGFLTFDFSTSNRPQRLEVILSNVKLVKIMVYNYLIPRSKQLNVIGQLNQLEKYTKKNSETTKKAPFSNRHEKAVLIGVTCENFYSNIHHRSVEFATSKMKEEINVQDEELSNLPVQKNFGDTLVGKSLATKPDTDFKRERGAGIMLLSPVQNEADDDDDESASQGTSDSSSEDEDDEDEEDQRNESAKVERLLYLTEPKRDHISKKLHGYLHLSSIAPEAKAARLVDALIDSLAKTYLLCRHLAIVIAYFEHGHVRKSAHFGTYNVELFVALYSRIIDIHNIEIVLYQLDGFEVGCVYCRLGWLALFNPLKPEGAWELDIGRIEERIVAKMLCLLSTNEPGKNWLKESFKWHREVDPMPGWELTVSWMSEEGMPNRGILTLTYYSGEGSGKKGCKVNLNYRYSLVNVVLMDEQEVADEGGDRLNQSIVEKRSDKYMLLNSTVYYTYIINNITVKNKKKALG